MTTRVESKRVWLGRTAQHLAPSLRGAIGMISVLAAWQISVWLIHLPAYFYPSPIAVLRAFAELIRKGILPAYIEASAGRYAAGVGLGLVLGILFGLAIGLSNFWSKLLGPIINFFYAIVEVAWIPLLVIWIGYGFNTILIALTYVVFFPVLFNTLSGVQTVPRVLPRAVKSLGASPHHILFEIVLPSALPNIITGLRVGAGFAFRGLIFAEMIAAHSGLGYLIFSSATTEQTSRVVVGMITMGVLWLLLDRLILRPVEIATIERWGLVQAAGGGA